MRHPIATAPRSGELVNLQDELGSSLEIGRWSSETGDWVGSKGEPLRIVPTHWVTFSDDRADHRETIRAPNRTRKVLIACAAVVCIGATLAAVTFGFLSVLQKSQNKTQFEQALGRDVSSDRGKKSNRITDSAVDASSEQAKQATQAATA